MFKTLYRLLVMLIKIAFVGSAGPKRGTPFDDGGAVWAYSF